METRKEVKQVQVDYQCPKCKSGYLRPTGIALTTNPPQFPHKCNNPDCDYMETFMDKQYPYIDYEEIIPNKNVNLGVCQPTIITANGWDGTGTPNSHIIPSNNGNNF